MKAYKNKNKLINFLRSEKRNKIGIWNRYIMYLRKKSIWIDLRNANLINADLEYADLGNVDLRRVDLRYADLRYAKLEYADLRGTDLKDANLRNADLKDADLGNTELEDADLENANLRNADLKYANLRNNIFLSKDMTKSRCMQLVFNQLPDSDGYYYLYKRVRKEGDKYFSCFRYVKDFEYKIGEWKEELNYDEDITKSCSSGLHCSHASYCIDGNCTLLVKVHINDIITILDGKVRCKRLFVLSECQE